MRPIVISRRARADLREIAEFTAADDPKREASLVAELRARCQSLSKTTMQGRPPPEIEPDPRTLVFRSCNVLHRVLADRIMIDRVVHAAPDRAKRLPDG